MRSVWAGIVESTSVTRIQDNHSIPAADVWHGGKDFTNGPINGKVMPLVDAGSVTATGRRVMVGM